MLADQAQHEHRGQHGDDRARVAPADEQGRVDVRGGDDAGQQGEDDDTRVIVGYLESIDCGDEFMKAAEAAAEAPSFGEAAVDEARVSVERRDGTHVVRCELEVGGGEVLGDAARVYRLWNHLGASVERPGDEDLARCGAARFRDLNDGRVLRE